MLIPIRVLVNLRITLVQKLSIGVVFIVGIITMVFAIVRVISLNSSVNGGQVSTQWLMLWAGIEGAVGMSLPQNINPLRPTIVNTDHSANLFCLSPSNHRRLPPVLRHLHPRPRRGVSRTVRPPRREYLEQRQQPPDAPATFTNKICCAERKRDARGYGVEWLGPRFGEQEKLGRGRDYHHAGVESEEPQGCWDGYGEGETPEDGAQWGCIAGGRRVKKSRIGVFVYCWNLECHTMTDYTHTRSAVTRGRSRPRTHKDRS